MNVNAANVMSDIRFLGDYILLSLRKDIHNLLFISKNNFVCLQSNPLLVSYFLVMGLDTSYFYHEYITNSPDIRQEFWVGVMAV